MLVTLHGFHVLNLGWYGKKYTFFFKLNSVKVSLCYSQTVWRGGLFSYIWLEFIDPFWREM